MSPRLLLSAVGFVLFVALLGATYAKGRADNEAKHVALALENERAAAKVLSELAAAEEANRMLARALEDAAYAEPPTNTCGLPRSRVLRLKER